MTIEFKYGGKVLHLSSYTSEQERDSHLLMSAKENPSIDEVFFIFRNNIDVIKGSKNFSFFEKIMILYELRAISVGEELEIKFKCTKCEKPNDGVIIVKNNVINPEKPIITQKTINGIKFEDNYNGKTKTFEDIQSYTKFDLEDLDVDEFEKIEKAIKKHVVKYNFEKEVKCFYCQHINKVDIGDEKFVYGSLSEDTIASFYTNVSDIVNNGGYTKEDVMKMLPLERSIYIGMLNKWLENKNAS
jgi:hypothetical protein